MTQRILRCAIYTRKSTEDGLGQEFNSLDAQREACDAYIKSQASLGWRTSPDRFDDGGFSGGTLDRPAMRQLIEQVTEGRIKVIVVYKIDRLTRSLADFARLVELLDKHDASFVSVTQQFNTTTSMGRLTLNVLLSFAQFEREITGERIRDKIASSKRRGMWMGGHPPLGYDIMNRRLIINDPEAVRVRQIYNLALEERSLAKLVARLNAEGIISKRWTTQTGRTLGGAPFVPNTLSRLLRNPIYLGKIRHGSDLFEGEHDAIVKQSLWNEVQLILDENTHTRVAKNSKSNALLAGVLFDDRGYRMVPTHARKGKTLYHYYVSTPLIRGSNQQAGSVGRVSAPRIERQVLGALQSSNIAPPGTDDTKLLHHVVKIVLHPSEIEIRLKDETCHHGLIRLSADLRSSKNGLRIIEQHGTNQRSESLIRSVVLAHRWRQNLERGQFKTIRDLSEAKGISESYAWKILRLSYLAPDIVEAILDGRHPSHLSLHQINDAKLSRDWGSQRRALGFPETP